MTVSAASLSLVRRPLRADRVGQMPHILADIKEGIGFAWRYFVIRTLIAFWSVNTIATAALIPALSFSVTIDRRFGPSLFGFPGSTWSVGYLCGSLLAGRLGGKRVGLRIPWCNLAIRALVVAIAVTAFPAVYLVAMGCLAIAGSLAFASSRTFREAGH